MKTLNRTPLYSAIMAAAAVHTAFANAETREDQRYNFSLDKVTVAATLTEQKLEDVASTVSVIDSDTMEKQGVRNIRDLIRYEPGVSVGSANGSDAERFGAKGFNVRGLDENYVKITVDGIDQAKSFTPSGNPFQRAGRNNVDMDSLKRVEIVKGPASTLYGSDAIAGVVAFTTKDPSDYLEEQGDDTAGSLKILASNLDDSVAETFTLANRTGQLESLLVYTNRDASEVEIHDDADVERDDVDYDSQNILAKLQYQINDAHRIGLTLEDYSTDTFTDMPRKLASSSYSDFYHGDDTNDRQRVSFFHQWDANNALFDRSIMTLDWQNSEIDQETSSLYGSVTPRLRIKDYGHEEELKRFSAQFNKALNQHQLTYGVEYKETDLTNYQDTLYPTAPASNTTTRAVPLVEGTDLGIYLQDEITFMEGKLTVTPGVRYDKHEAEPQLDNQYTPGSAYAATLVDHDSDKVTFRLGSVYKLDDHYSVFAQYSQGFKSPDLLPMYYGSHRNYGPGFNYLTLPNPDLKPEESDSYEVGFRFNNTHGNYEIVAFYNEYQDFIENNVIGTTHDGSSYDQVSQNINIGEVTIKGIEARASVWLDSTLGAPEGTSLQMALAYADGENKSDDEPLDSVSPLNAVIGLSYDAPSETWGSTVNWTLVDEKRKSDMSDDTESRTHGYGLVDLSGYYKPTKNLTLRANLNNVTDKKYQEWEDIRGLTDGSELDRKIQAGRNISLSATYSF